MLKSIIWKKIINFTQNIFGENRYHYKLFIYAPFSKPALGENHLADMLRYSKEFSAHRISLIIMDLRIDEKYRPVLQHYSSFFDEKGRTQRFYDLEIENWNKNVIEVEIMSVLCKAKVVSFEEIVHKINTDGELENNKYIVEFEKYDLINPFWRMCEETFGYTDVQPKLSKFLYTLFVTYLAKSIRVKRPQGLKNYCSFKSGNIIAFMNSMMNSIIFKDRFNKLSNFTYKDLNIHTVFDNMEVRDFADLEIFRKIDEFIIKWLIARLLNEDPDVKLSGYTVPEVCKMRRKMHYGNLYFFHITALLKMLTTSLKKHTTDQRKRCRIFGNNIYQKITLSIKDTAISTIILIKSQIIQCMTICVIWLKT